MRVENEHRHMQLSSRQKRRYEGRPLPDVLGRHDEVVHAQIAKVSRIEAPSRRAGMFEQSAIQHIPAAAHLLHRQTGLGDRCLRQHRLVTLHP